MDSALRAASQLAHCSAKKQIMIVFIHSIHNTRVMYAVIYLQRSLTKLAKGQEKEDDEWPFCRDFIHNVISIDNHITFTYR